MRGAARGLRTLWRRLRFEAWALRARVQMRRGGGRLKVEAPYGAVLAGGPKVNAVALGHGSGVFVLRLGRDVRIGRGFTLDVSAHGDNVLELGDRTEVMDAVRVLLRSGTVHFGRRCVIKDGVWLKSDGRLSAGDDVTLGPHAAVHCSEAITLDDCVGTGERVSIIDLEHTFTGDDVHYMRKPIATTPVSIGRNSMMAINAVILRGARIGRNAVVGANAVVRGGDYPDASLIAGNPAKVVRTLDASDQQA